MKKKLVVCILLIAFVLMTASTAFAASYSGTALNGWTSYYHDTIYGDFGTLDDHCTDCYITKFKNNEVESQHVAYFCNASNSESYGSPWQIGQGQYGPLKIVPPGNIYMHIANESQYYGQYQMKTWGSF